MKHTKLRLMLLALVALALVVPAISAAAAPVATTGQATNVTASAATLNGTVDPGGEATTYHFEYGTTTSYGTNTPDASAGASNGNQAASAQVSNLAPDTTYHFRLVATNASGTVTGQDATFKTPAAGSPQGNAITLVATPARVIFGRSTTLSGTVTGPDRGGVKVTIQQRPHPFTDQFKNVADTTTDANGNFTLPNVIPALHTDYRAVAKTKPPVTSAPVRVKVRLSVTRRVSDATIKRGQRVRFSGIVKPAHNVKLVRIQRRTRSGSYRTVSKTLTRASSGNQSAYAKKVRIFRTGVYRVRVYPADGDHAAGTSARKRIRVVR